MTEVPPPPPPTIHHRIIQRNPLTSPQTTSTKRSTVPILPTHSDETHLESFIDSLTSSSFPSKIRRTLENLRYLNDVGDEMVEDWRNRQNDCIAEEVRGAMIDFKERWEKDSVDGADAGQVGRKRK